MDYTQIERFLTIVKNMNLGRAASELYISQSALSQSISKLESELGLKLFHRINNKLILTKDAEALLENFERINQAYHDFQDKVETLKQKETDDYIIVGFSGSSSMFASLSINEFFNRYEGDLITPLYTDAGNLERMLSSGQIDFAISYPQLGSQAISSKVIYTEPTEVAVPLTHPFAKKTVLSLRDLEKLSFMGLSKGHLFRNNCDAICAKCGINVNYKKTFNRSGLNDFIQQDNNPDQLAAFVASGSFESMYGGHGYISVPIDDARFQVYTTLSWLSRGQAQYEHAGFIDYVTIEYGKQRVLYEKLYKKLFTAK